MYPARAFHPHVLSIEYRPWEWGVSTHESTPFDWLPRGQVGLMSIVALQDSDELIDTYTHWYGGSGLLSSTGRPTRSWRVVGVTGTILNGVSYREYQRQCSPLHNNPYNTRSCELHSCYCTVKKNLTVRTWKQQMKPRKWWKPLMTSTGTALVVIVTSVLPLINRPRSCITLSGS